MLDVLKKVAFDVHQSQSAATDDAAHIPLDVIFGELQRARGSRAITEGALLEHLDQRAGILFGLGNKTFRFPHRSFQEYLTSQYLADDEYYPEQLVAVARAEPTAWREVLAFSVLSHAGGNSIRMVWDTVQELLPTDPGEDATGTDFRLAIVLGIAFAESERLRCPGDKRRHREAHDRIRTWLVEALDRGVLSAKDRIEGCAALGTLGDPRIDDWRANLLPSPNGEFRLGRFPVTVQEYRQFVEADDYDDGRFWVGAPRRWPAPDRWEQQLPFLNRPVVGVCWYEATAYCMWLTEQSGETVGLPTEHQQLHAATPDGREWVWAGKDKPSAEHTNFNGDVGHPTPVGCYRAGIAAGGHLDLSGNIWEWSGSGSRTHGLGAAPGAMTAACYRSSASASAPTAAATTSVSA